MARCVSSTIVDSHACEGSGCDEGVLAPQGDAGIDASQLAYIGDDVNDAGIMALVARDGLVGAPLDAIPSLLHGAHYRCRRPGGYGAFRDFAEWILDLRAKARAQINPSARDHQWGGLS